VAINRLERYLYSTPNIVGSLLALGGLGLFFGGFIHAYWGAIVAGLYVAPVLAWPRDTLADTVEQTELSPELLAQQVRKLVDSAAKALPKEAVAELNGIQATLVELLPRLKDMQDRGAISGKDSFTVIETVRRYLPDTLGAYLRLPRFYAEMNASQALTGQLKLLNTSLQEVAQNAFAGDAEKLASNGRFLQSKFSEATPFRP
jgi:hypothetical protein